MKSILVLKQVPHETPGTVQTVLQQAGFDCRSVGLYGEVPQRLALDEAAGLLVLGGPMNVDQVDLYPFLAREIEWIRRAIDRDTPVLGICLGSQLLAKALGAKVYANRIKEIGWYSVELTPAAAEDRLFGGHGPTLTVFQWHGDTFDLPAGAVHLARSELCENQAFRYGQRAYGLQFHLEVTADMVADWLSEPHNDRELAALDYIDPAAILRQMPHELPAMQAIGGQVFARFASLCSEV